MEYAIKEIARVIGAKTNQLLDDTVSLLLTDSRRLSFPEKSLFFALKTKTNDGHRYIQELYKLRIFYDQEVCVLHALELRGKRYATGVREHEGRKLPDRKRYVTSFTKTGDSPQEAIQHPRDRHHR